MENKIYMELFWGLKMLEMNPETQITRSTIHSQNDQTEPYETISGSFTE